MTTEEKVIKEEGDHTRKDEDEVQKKKIDTVVPARYLDDSILFNIFTRIPADLLHSNHFKYQCRQWRRLISDSYFMDIHKNISQFKPGIIYMEQRDRHLYEPTYLLKYMELSRSEILRVRTLHDFKNTQFFITSSCNGLLLITEGGPSLLFHIMNPVTKKQATFHAMKKYYFCELVYVGEYKVVQMYDPNSDDRIHYSYSVLHITTLNGGEPPKDIQVPENCKGLFHRSHIYINGVFYWVVDEHIASFNLNTETFHILQTPDIGRIYRLHLLELYGSLSLVERLYESRNGTSFTMKGTNVWSMVRGEWEKVFTLNDQPDLNCFLDHANLLMYIDSHRICAYDVKTNQRRLVNDSKGLAWSFNHQVHVNSFIDPLAIINPQSMA